MTRLPAGTVTFLFTDIEGSTRLASELGDQAYGSVLDQERLLVVNAAEREGGVAFGSEGDAHFVAFDTAGAAIRAAVEAQRALARHSWPAGQVRVRMGIHTGAVRVVGDDYVGLEVHRVARVAAAGHGGQVLVTDATRAIAGDLPAGVELLDLGEHRLKDLARPERLFQVSADGLEREFPPLRTLDVTPNNLPSQVTTFVGRGEVEVGATLLQSTRLLTLTGPGGTGKTRLSLAIASSAMEQFPDGAWFVPLAPITDPDLIASTIAAAIGLLAPGQPPAERVRTYLRDRAALLVLDNFEQVVTGSPVVADLLLACPDLKVVATSRAPLRITGEQELPVPPLTVPDPSVDDIDQLTHYEAVRLFIERASAVRPDFSLTPANAAAVAEIVRRLDGLPLAIELAAARVRLLSPVAMAQRLGDRLGLLTAGGRDLPERQRTLRGAIDWSHDLLEPEDQCLFARLGVFAGGGPIELATEVCRLESDRAQLEVEPGLERLAEQSLIHIESDGHGDTRFSLLETIREYALDKLGERIETRVLQDRHADAYLAIVRDAAAGGPGSADQGQRLDRLEKDHDNLRAAFDHLVASGDTDRASELAFQAWRFWQMRGHLVEARGRLDRLLAMPEWPAEASVARLRALEAAGGLAYWAGDRTAASRLYGEAVEQARGLGDDGQLANALYNQFFARRPSDSIDDWARQLGEDPALLEEALDIWTRMGDEVGVAKALWGIAEHNAYAGDYAASENAATRALDVFERIGDRFWIAWGRFTRAFGRLLDGRVSDAAVDIEVALRAFHERRDVSGEVLVFTAISSMLLLAGRIEDGYAVGAAGRRTIAETGIHLATLYPSGSVPMADPDTTVPELRVAADRGATWSRDRAVDESLRLATELAAMHLRVPRAGGAT
jgi:predicted ATPase/class 3 adenylate cyclase